jgi:hypothetical protein
MKSAKLLDASGNLATPESGPAVTEITRSFSFKINLGNYENADFFCSMKAQCKPEDVEEVSEGLYEFCADEVRKSIGSFREARKAKGL